MKLPAHYPLVRMFLLSLPPGLLHHLLWCRAPAKASGGGRKQNPVEEKAEEKLSGGGEAERLESEARAAEVTEKERAAAEVAEEKARADLKGCP